MRSASVSSFTPTLLVGDASAAVQLTGVALDPTSSVRAVRFEAATTCTAGSSSSNTVVVPNFALATANGALTVLTLPMSGTSGFAAGAYAVCVDYAWATAAVPSYQRVGGVGAFVLAGTVSSFTPSALANSASVSITLTGEAVSAAAVTGSVRAVRFEQAATCTASTASANPVVVPSSITDSDASMTEVVASLSGTGGLSAGCWSVCVDWAASSTVPLYMQATSSCVLVGK